MEACMTALLMLLSSFAYAADAVVPAAPLPWYFKMMAALGVLTFGWKLVQSNVPKLLGWLLPLALKATDAFVMLVQTYPMLRWVVLGDKENFLKTVNTLLDGLEAISDAVQARLEADLDAAAAGAPLPPEPGASAPAPAEAPKTATPPPSGPPSP